MSTRFPNWGTKRNAKFSILFLAFIAAIQILISETNLVNSSPFIKASINKSIPLSSKKVGHLFHEEHTSAMQHPGHYETINETVERLKRDVVLTATFNISPDKAFALFQIEGMMDRSFKLNTQLMDGFIITNISDNKVTLKNQIGNETIEFHL